MNTSLQMLSPLDETISMMGDKVRGAGWYGRTTGLHTVAIRVANFQGRIAVEASIATDPSDDDWYTVLPSAAAYIQYPRPGFVVSLNASGETSIFGFNFSTNAVWLRASVDRSYLIPNISTPLQIMPFGTISYVLVNY